eukprot:TRINITY_DN25510_c0_g1_i2.p1 TRINITY_DN25510_c0_g1~~TRINITY_DN25510_c0_g1_i2.p1  ORF type:complete len:166 (-),score=42.35 TRINITY_DN25510_c0_g1_i2:116-613(-)
MQREAKLLILGLDGVGKTTILYQLRLGELISAPPTNGFNAEAIDFKDFKFLLWDWGGNEIHRPLWRKHLDETKVLVFVVDSTDRERIDLAKEELHSLLAEEKLHDALLLVFANKKDLDGMSTAEITEKLGLNTISGRLWHIIPTNATTAEGLNDGLEWINKSIPK